MHKESCRFFALTVSLFGIICMAKDLSAGKESAINKNIDYINKDFYLKGEFHEQDYENDYFRKKKYAEQDEYGFESNVQNVGEKSENIIPINNQLQAEAAVKTQVNGNDERETEEKNEYNIKIIKKRKNNQGHLRPGRQNPLSYLHINHETKYNEPEIYIFDAKNFNEDVIKRFTRTENKYDLPVCDIKDKQENIYAPSTISSSSFQKRGLSDNNQISTMNFNHELKRKVRSQWRFRDHYYDFGTKYKYKSPVEYNENNNLENTNEMHTSDLNDEKVFFDQIDNNDKHSKNFMMKRGTTNEKEQMPSNANETPMQSSNNSIEHNAKNKSQVPIVQSPSIAPLTLPSGVVPNISYVYLQPLPLGNSMLLNQPKPVESSSASSKKSNSPVNTDNKGNNDLITISIDPRTLQNKILHAEFLKKSDVKKTPDTLSIELSPKETVPTNSSKHQKTVQKPLKISASVKNNSIFISGGDSKGYQRNNANEKKNQLNGQIKSISSQINMNDILDDHKSIHEYNLQNDMNSIDKSKTDETKVLIINAKQKEVCATESPCKLLSTYCSIDLCDNASHCKRSTRNLQNFREVHEIVDKDTSITVKLMENKTISYNISDDPMVIPTSNPLKSGIKIKRETNQMNISKLINLLKPVIVLSPKEDNEGSEDESGDSEGIINKVNLKGSSEMALEKGNKKVENKILEGFINSIIANYSKDEIKPLMKETTEKSEDGSEALLKLLESNLPKRNERDKESSDEKQSETWNLTPVLVPESQRISKDGDNPEYAKLGPFDENFIKSFLRKGYIS